MTEVECAAEGDAYTIPLASGDDAPCQVTFLRDAATSGPSCYVKLSADVGKYIQMSILSMHDDVRKFSVTCASTLTPIMKDWPL